MKWGFVFGLYIGLCWFEILEPNGFLFILFAQLLLYGIGRSIYKEVKNAVS